MYKSKHTVVLIEPCYYGIGFLEAVYSRGYNIISVVASSENPLKFGYEGKYNGLIVADVRDHKSIIEALEHSKYIGAFDAIIPSNDYVTNITSMVAEHFNMRRMPYLATLRARRKDLARAVYKENGVPSVQYGVANNLESAEKIIKEINYPVVIKPSNCACSENVLFINNENDLHQAIKVMENFKVTMLDFVPHEAFLVEEFIKGPELSVEIFMNKGEFKFVSVTEKTKGDLPYFTELSHVVPTSIHVDRVDDLVNVAKNAILALGFDDGAFHVETILSARGPIIVEVNARPGGDNITTQLLPNAFGVNLFEHVIDYYLDLPININPTKNLSSAVAYLAAKQDGLLKSIEGINNIKNLSNIVKYNIKVKPGDYVKIPKDSNDRLGYVISIAKTPSEAKESAQSAIESIKLNF